MLRRLGQVLGLAGLLFAGLFSLAAVNETYGGGFWIMAAISALIGAAFWYVLAGE